MKCETCGDTLDLGEACYRCEVVAAQRAVCELAEVGCWEQCSSPDRCDPIFTPAGVTPDARA